VSLVEVVVVVMSEVCAPPTQMSSVVTRVLVGGRGWDS